MSNSKPLLIDGGHRTTYCPECESDAIEKHDGDKKYHCPDCGSDCYGANLKWVSVDE